MTTITDPSQRTKLWARAILSATVTGMFSAGCAADDPPAESQSSESSRAVLGTVVAGRSALVRRVVPGAETIYDLVPAESYEFLDGSRASLSNRVIVGSITDVERGVGFRATGEDGQGSEMLDFDDPTAMWKTIHLTVEVSKLLAGESSKNPIMVGISLSGGNDFDTIAKALLATDSVVLALEEGSPVFEYDSEVQAIVWDATTMVSVYGNSLDAPALEGEDEKEFLGGATTLEELERRIVERQQNP